MKIGFFGGSFNPSTNIHIVIAKDLLKNGIVNKVVFVPIGDFYSKKGLIEASKRLKMLKLAVQNEKNIEIDDFETSVQITLFAKDAFKIISEKYKNDEPYFIMGSDNFVKMSNWEGYDEIIELYKYIVISRNSFKTNQTKDNILIFTPSKSYNFDSTTVRRLIKENKNVSNLINANVYNYIKLNNLYA